MKIAKLESSNAPAETLNLLNLKYYSGLYESIYKSNEARKKYKKNAREKRK